MSLKYEVLKALARATGIKRRWNGKIYPHTMPREFKGLAHAELTLMFLERF